MGADLPRSVLVVSEEWRAAAVGPGVCGTPDGGLAMPVATGVLYLDISVSLWGPACGFGGGRRREAGWGVPPSGQASYFVVFTHVDGAVDGKRVAVNYRSGVRALVGVRVRACVCADESKTQQWVEPCPGVVSRVRYAQRRRWRWRWRCGRSD